MSFQWKFILFPLEDGSRSIFAFKKFYNTKELYEIKLTKPLSLSFHQRLIIDAWEAILFKQMFHLYTRFSVSPYSEKFCFSFARSLS